ncbi:peptidoglycan-binding protein [Spirillospora sp. CA-294931]|uniref:peptidoglycan-binding protein n=1 Tax=Spirillospora sp. CA-294931 TaxID=3240042 RepID=UPI003D928E16
MALGERRRPVRITAVTVLVVVAGAAVTWTVIGLGGEGTESAAGPSGPPRGTKVQRTTLTRTETVKGNLGYGDATPVPVAGTSKGTFTWLPAEGASIERGKAVYAIDARKVPLFYGTTPVYRTIKPGDEGKDVAMLERNLSVLGYTGFTVDDAFSDGTADAVRAWQEDLGREQTGTVAKGEVVVASGARRVAEVKAIVGDGAQGAALTWTGTTRKVIVDLEVEHEDLVSKGTRATVELPDGGTVEARVATVGTTATAEETETSGGGTAAKEPTVRVELTVKDQKRLGRHQAAPVDVTLGAESRANVLVVPVTALVALREGGYALEAVGTDGTTRYVKAETGMFAGGLVEVSGAGITEGMTVGAPS